MSSQPYYQQILATQPQQNPMPLVDGTSLLPYLGMNVSSSPSTPPSPSMVPVLYPYPVPQGQPWIHLPQEVVVRLNRMWFSLMPT
uniref:Uncharacterized protein n=1 Tax=Timema bartmani TaxID=61472 RepID=A0A7R9FCE0_9NEOP|nr:unnamed protein product [Timema bartmani]